MRDVTLAVQCKICALQDGATVRDPALRDGTVSETSEHALPVARATAIFRAIFGAVQSATSEDELVTHCFAFWSHFLLLPGNV